jgi:hypothetical protein
MRVVTNREQIQRNRKIAQILFVVSIVILFGGLIITNVSTVRSDIMLFVPCLIMPIGLFTTLISVRLTNQYVRLPHPEDAIRDSLKGINKRSTLYNYVLKPKHVLLTPQGVYTLTTRFHETRIKVEGEHWINYKARGPLGPALVYLKQEHLSDPFKQARQEAASVQAIVDEALPGSGITVQPIIVFTGLKANVEIEDPIIPVVYADPKKKPNLKAVIKEDKVVNQPEKPAKGGKGKPAQEETPPGGLTQEQLDTLNAAFLSDFATVNGPADTTSDEA